MENPAPDQVFETNIASYLLDGDDAPGVIDVLSSVHSVFLPHCSDDRDEWEPVDDCKLEQMLGEEECEDDSPTFQVKASQWFWQRTKSVFAYLQKRRVLGVL